MDAAMGFISAHAADDTIVGLMAAKDEEPFYEEFGFVARPNEKLGSGMTLFWRKEG